MTDEQTVLDPTLSPEVTAVRAAARLARVLEVTLAEVCLSLPQYRLLAFLSAGSSGASGVAKDMTVSPPSVTALVDGVVARGLVERRPHPNDRRRVELLLTDSGADTLAEAERCLAARVQELAGHLNAAEAKRALDGLALWARARNVERAARKATS